MSGLQTRAPPPRPNPLMGFIVLHRFTTRVLRMTTPKTSRAALTDTSPSSRSHTAQAEMQQGSCWSVNNYVAVSESGNVRARPGFRPLQITGVGGGFREPHVAPEHTLPFSLFSFLPLQKKKKKDVNLNCPL